MKKALILAIVLLAGLSLASWASADAEREGVEAAVRDYVEGLYLVDPARIERSVHPDMWKRGFYRQDGQYKLAPMKFDQLVALAGRWNKEGRVDPAKAPKKIEVFDVLDKTASAKLTADWGIDYFHLGKVDGKWMIMNVLWQSPPPSATE